MSYTNVTLCHTHCGEGNVPVLFPSGKYGEFHPREVKLSFSEYIKHVCSTKIHIFERVQNLYFIICAKKSSGSFPVEYVMS